MSSVPTIIVASDASSVREEIAAQICDPDTTVVQVTSGPEAISALRDHDADLLVVDMQIANMGAMAVCLELRLEESYEDVDHVPVLMLLDRRPDVFLARRGGAEGWLVKPLAPLALRRAVSALLAGDTYYDESYKPVPVLVGSPTLTAGP